MAPMRHTHQGAKFIKKLHQVKVKKGQDSHSDQNPTEQVRPIQLVAPPQFPPEIVIPWPVQISLK